MKKNNKKQGSLLGFGKTVVEVSSVAGGAIGGTLAAEHFDLNGPAKFATIGGGAVAGYGIGKGLSAGMELLLGDKGGDSESSGKSGKKNKKDDEDEDDSSSSSSETGEESSEETEEEPYVRKPFFSDLDDDSQIYVDTEEKSMSPEGIAEKLKELEDSIDNDINNIESFNSKQVGMITEECVKLRSANSSDEFEKIKKEIVDKFAILTSDTRTKFTSIEKKYKNELDIVSKSPYATKQTIKTNIDATRTLIDFKFRKSKNNCTGSIKFALSTVNSVTYQDIVNKRDEERAAKQIIRNNTVETISKIVKEIAGDEKDFGKLDVETAAIINNIDCTPIDNIDTPTLTADIRRYNTVVDKIIDTARNDLGECIKVFAENVENLKINIENADAKKALGGMVKMVADKDIKDAIINAESKITSKGEECRKKVEKVLEDAKAEKKRKDKDKKNVKPESTKTKDEAVKDNTKSEPVKSKDGSADKVEQIKEGMIEGISNSIDRMEKKVQKYSSMYTNNAITLEDFVSKLNNLYTRCNFSVNSGVKIAVDEVFNLSGIKDDAKKSIQSDILASAKAIVDDKIHKITEDIMAQFPKVIDISDKRFIIIDVEENTGEEESNDKMKTIEETVAEADKIVEESVAKIDNLTKVKLNAIQTITSKYLKGNGNLDKYVNDLNAIIKSFVTDTDHLRKDGIEKLDKLNDDNEETANIIAVIHNTTHILNTTITEKRAHFADGVAVIKAPVKSIGIGKNGLYTKEKEETSIPEKIGKMNYSNFTESKAPSEKTDESAEKKDDKAAEQESSKEEETKKQEQPSQKTVAKHGKKLSRRERKMLNQKNK